MMILRVSINTVIMSVLFVTVSVALEQRIDLHRLRRYRRSLVKSINQPRFGDFFAANMYKDDAQVNVLLKLLK